MKTFPKILAAAALIATPAFAQAPDSATTNPPSTAVGSGTVKALQSPAAPQHESTNTKASHPKHTAAHHPRRTPRAAA